MITYKQAKQQIRKQARVQRQYWNDEDDFLNVISSILKQVDKELGRDEANRLIRECRLARYGWDGLTYL